MTVTTFFHKFSCFFCYFQYNFVWEISSRDGQTFDSGVKGAWHVFVYELKFLVFKFAILVHEKRVSNLAFANFLLKSLGFNSVLF